MRIDQTQLRRGHSHNCTSRTDADVTAQSKLTTPAEGRPPYHGYNRIRIIFNGSQGLLQRRRFTTHINRLLSDRKGRYIKSGTEALLSSTPEDNHRDVFSVRQVLEHPAKRAKAGNGEGVFFIRPVDQYG